jgi:RHS repeat-associated protein
MMMPGRNYESASGEYRYGFNGKEQDKDINSLTTYDYGFRIYNPALGRFLSVDPLTEKFAYYSPYQFAGNKPIACIDLEGAEEKWKVTTNFHLDYQPVLKAPNVGTAINNAIGNGLNWVWNGTLGAALTGGKNAWNWTVDQFSGNPPPAPDPIYSISLWWEGQKDYLSETPRKQIWKDIVDDATDLRNYEMLPSLIIAHQFSLSNPSPVLSARLPLQEEIFTNSIATRGAAETYAEMTSYKGYWNANDFIKVNNKAFDLISTIERKVVDVATTSKANLKISSWEKNKLERLASNKSRPQGYGSILQLYVKKGQYTAEQIANYKKSLNDYITNEGLKNVNVEVSEIPKK